MKVNTVIIGAGISGLSTANFLSKKTSDFLIIESSNRVGGTINSSKVDGYILENGPNTVLDNNTAIQELLSDLSITDKIIEDATYSPWEHCGIVIRDPWLSLIHI